MSQCHSYNLSSCLAVDHRTRRRSHRSSERATSRHHELDYSLRSRACQEENGARYKNSRDCFFLDFRALAV